MTESLTIGERVAFYRRRRGLSQEVVAGLVGRTEDWLSKIENNRAELDRLSVIRKFADVLDVSLGDLLGEPTFLDWTADSGTATVTALRTALMDYRQLNPILRRTGSTAEAPAIAHLERDVADVFDAYQAARFGFVTARTYCWQTRCWPWTPTSGPSSSVRTRCWPCRTRSRRRP
ncbi:helix-turn-helix domain-containing protein [Actinomycetospora rhizophila]|uniref:Helix-turn-helix domain-containing protein n=1 Tax=Actinomycetospora rhizophila TaxID=1416876 RepID=A0ABV9ZM11_9PSEU